MCLRCVTRDFNTNNASYVESLTEALLESVTLLTRLTERGATLDDAEKQAYDRLLAFAKAKEYGAQGPSKEELADALRKAFPDATVVVGSPEELQAMLEKDAKEASGNKPN